MNPNSVNGHKAQNHMKAFMFLLSGLLVVLLSACKSNFPQDEFSESAVIGETSVFTLGPGDAIRIRVYGHDDLSGAYKIDDTGRISLPLVLGVNVKGLTIIELELKITEVLAENYIVDPKVSIDLVQARPFCILGEVRNPGCFSGVHGLNSAQAIAIAGGYTYRAFKEKFAITREDGRKVYADTSTSIYSGDTLEVYERYF